MSALKLTERRPHSSWDTSGANRCWGGTGTSWSGLVMSWRQPASQPFSGEILHLVIILDLLWVFSPAPCGCVTCFSSSVLAVDSSLHLSNKHPSLLFRRPGRCRCWSKLVLTVCCCCHPCCAVTTRLLGQSCQSMTAPPAAPDTFLHWVLSPERRQIFSSRI